jgi:hypothetical protein
LEGCLAVEAAVGSSAIVVVEPALHPVSPVELAIPTTASIQRRPG